MAMRSRSRRMWLRSVCGVSRAAEPRIGGVVDLRIGDERARQPRTRLIEALARQRQQFLGGRQRARGGAQLGAARSPGCAASRRAPAVRRLSTRTSSSARTGTAISAAAVGVGARTSAAKSISVTSVSWPTAEISGIMLSAAARTTILLVERPEVLQRAAAARHDDEIGLAGSGRTSAAR